MAYKFVVFAVLLATANAAPAATSYSTVSHSAPVAVAAPTLKLAAPAATSFSTISHATPVAHVAHVAAPLAHYTSPIAQYAAPIAHYSAPAVTHYSAPAVAHYSAPAVAHYSAPTVTHYATPTVTHVSSPVAHVSAPVAHVAAVHKPIVAEPEHYAPAHYDFEYSVHDEHTGDIKSQKESRQGDAVHGVYSLIEPDGTKRTVEYTADEHSGFNAIVHREPAAHPVAVKAPVVKAIAAPVAHVAHVAPVAHYAAPTVAHVAPVAHYTTLSAPQHLIHH